MSGGLDARSLQDMRREAQQWAEGDVEGFSMMWADRFAADVLVLLDERERLEASLGDAREVLAEIADGYERHNPGWWIKNAKGCLARLTVGERASLDSPEAQQ